MGLFYGSNLFLYINTFHVETFYHTQPIKMFDERFSKVISFLECVKYLKLNPCLLVVLPTRRIDWLVVVCATAKPQPPHNFSATLQGFLPSKLEPLGFSLDGQLRVAS